jgi:hypothetical protein
MAGLFWPFSSIVSLFLCNRLLSLRHILCLLKSVINIFSHFQKNKNNDLLKASSKPNLISYWIGAATSYPDPSL